MKIKKLVLAIVLIISTILVGCGSSSTATSSQNNSSARVVTDMLGNEVSLSGEVNRVYFDWASGITLAMPLGAIEKVIAKPAAFEEDSFAWARVICPSINAVPTENDIFTSDNVESVLNLEPDVVITNTPDAVESYANIGIKALYVKFSDYDSFKESLLIVGKALGETEYNNALKYNQLLDENIAMVRERTANIQDSDKKKVYYMDSRFDDIYHTVGSGEIQESWIESAGGILATDGIFEGKNVEITIEEFLNLNPDIILIGAQTQAEVFDQLISDEILSELDAVKNEEVYRLPQGLFPWCRTGPEAAIHVIWAGKFLHPELFEDIDMKIVTKDFYKEFFGTDVPDEYIDEILAGHLTPNGR